MLSFGLCYQYDIWHFALSPPPNLLFGYSYHTLIVLIPLLLSYPYCYHTLIIFIPLCYHILIVIRFDWPNDRIEKSLLYVLIRLHA
jgi:hypothetical protein